MVNENAASVPEHTIIPPPKPKLSPAQQRIVDQEKKAFDLVPPGQTQAFQGGQVLKAGKSFVVDRTPKVPTRESNGVADQTVRVTDNLYGNNG